MLYIVHIKSEATKQFFCKPIQMQEKTESIQRNLWSILYGWWHRFLSTVSFCQEPRELTSSYRPNSGGNQRKTSQIQWPVPSIKAELVNVFPLRK